MKNLKKEKLIDSSVEYGGAAAGAIIGAGIGTAIAGPAGTVGGTLLGTAAEKAFLWAGEEIKKRCLSSSENRKIGSAHALAAEKIASKLNGGCHLRADNFFRTNVDERSTAEEVLEGMLFAAQRENEERKLPYLANLYANINFDSTISRPMANQLIKLAASVSFRQLEILSIIGRTQFGILEEPLRDTAFMGFEDYDDMSIAAEIFELYRMSLLISSSAILDSASFVPSLLVLNGMGELLYIHMELFNMPLDEGVQSVLNFLSDKSPSPDNENIVTGQLPTVSMQEIDALFEEKTANIPRVQIEEVDNEAGGKTLIIT